VISRMRDDDLHWTGTGAEYLENGWRYRLVYITMEHL